MTPLTVLCEKWLGRIGGRLRVGAEGAGRIAGQREHEQGGNAKVAQRTHEVLSHRLQRAKEAVYRREGPGRRGFSLNLRSPNRQLNCESPGGMIAQLPAATPSIKSTRM